MMNIILLTIFFGFITAVSIVLTGNRSLISGNITVKNFFRMIFDWRFIFAMILAVSSRFTFIYINNLLLRIPTLARNSTTITTFITALSYVFIIAANYIFLGERLSLQQIAGAGLIIGGIMLMVK
jgi:drug/metabolite transporter (DMT)-like permease